MFFKNLLLVPWYYVRSVRLLFLKYGPDRLRLDLGVRDLWSDWRSLFSKQFLVPDLVAGLTVACVAVPLSLAIALASGVSPGIGLVTAIVAGIVCGLFGGTPLSVSGPAAAMAVLIASVVEKFGIGGLLVVGAGCGIFQLICGIFGVGRLVKYVPTPVITGFTAGIGAIIFIGQLPRALGLPPVTQGHVIDVLKHLTTLISETQVVAASIAVSTILIAKGLPRLLPKLPAPLVAVALPTICVALFGWETPLIGEIPRSLPTPRLPEIPYGEWKELLGATLIVFSLASLETLLSASAVDKISRTRHDPDQELIGQGLGNLVVSLFGGIPVTGVIARSALNVRSGAKTRRAAIIHSVGLLATVYVLAPWIERIPIAALAGMLIAVALSMANPREFLQIAKASRSEAAVYAVTFFTIVLVDLIVGVQAGMVAALFIAAIQLGRTKGFVHSYGERGPARLSLSGPLTFLSVMRFEQLVSYSSRHPLGTSAILDVSRVTAIDSSGASMLLDFIEQMKDRGTKIILMGMNRVTREFLDSYDEKGVTQGLHAVTEDDVTRLMDETGVAQPRHRILFGVERFRREHKHHYAELFRQLADSQQPHTLFVTCSDSRISPNLITSTDPGELFIVRNVGNAIPPFGADDTPAEGAAVEYAVSFLNVREIIICGHSGCGAIRALSTDMDLGSLPSLRKWLAELSKVKSRCSSDCADDMARENILIQLENVRSYPAVKERLEKGQLKIRGWFYDVKETEILEWTGNAQIFETLFYRRAFG